MFPLIFLLTYNYRFSNHLLDKGISCSWTNYNGRPYSSDIFLVPSKLMYSSELAWLINTNRACDFALSTAAKPGKMHSFHFCIYSSGTVCGIFWVYSWKPLEHSWHRATAGVLIWTGIVASALMSITRDTLTNLRIELVEITLSKELFRQQSLAQIINHTKFSIECNYLMP